MKTRLLSFWQSRQRREQYLLGFCLIVFIAAGLFVGRQQAVGWHRQAVADLQQRQQAWQQMQRLESRMQAALARQPAALPAIKDLNVLLPGGMTLHQTAAATWESTAATVTFPSLLNALKTLEQYYALQASHLRLERQGKAIHLSHLELQRND